MLRVIWASLCLAALALACAGVAPPAYRSGWIGLSFVFDGLFRVAAYGGLGAAAMALIAGVLQVARNAPGRWLALLAVLLGAAAAAVPLSMRYLAGQVPPIHDLTTDPLDPPAFVELRALREGAPNPPEYDPANAVPQRGAYPDLRTIRVRADPQATLDAAEAVVVGLGWVLVRRSDAEGRLEAYDRSRWFGFVDDVVIRVRPGDGVTEVDVRSKSRVGRSDLGANARRIRAFRHALLAELTR